MFKIFKNLQEYFKPAKTVDLEPAKESQLVVADLSPLSIEKSQAVLCKRRIQSSRNRLKR